MIELVEFLRARLDTVELAARAAAGSSAAPWRLVPLPDGLELRDGDGIEMANDRVGGGFTEEELQHIALHEPARVLRQVENNRALVDAAEHILVSLNGRDVLNNATLWLKVLQRLAAVYSDHPDYREEWRP